MKKKKILFLGESYRADAITWMNGLKEFGDFEIITWELKTPSNGLWNRILRISEFVFAILAIKKIIAIQKPDMVIAERTTSYGFLASICGLKIVVIAQQGITDLWPKNSILLPFKKIIQNYAFKKATLIHAWGPVMTTSMINAKVDMNKVLIMPKGVNLLKFNNTNVAIKNKICSIVTRSLQPEYRHEIILKAFEIINKKGFDFELMIVGNGTEMEKLKKLALDLKINDQVIFKGRILNSELPKLLQYSNFYISMPTTEGVSASLFEAMATNCYPIVSDLPGNRSWIEHRENGQLVEVDNFEMLANEIIWAYENEDYRNVAIQKNRIFVEQNANYAFNMKFIASKYHQLLNN